MKAMKRICSLALTSVLVFGSCFPAFAAEQDGAAVPADVAGTVYETAVENLMEKEILSGYPDGLFHPDNTISRAETCVLVVKAMNPSPAALEAVGEGQFTDMAGYGWADLYVNYAVSRGVVNGTGTGKFEPGASVTYVEAAAMLLNAMGYQASELKGTWPNNYTNKARDLGLFKTVANSAALSVSANAKRGDVANMLNSVLKEIEEADLQPINQPKETEDQPKDESEQGKLIEETKQNIVPTMNFTGTTINLSLEDAVKQMQTTGPGFESAILARDGMLASALNMGEAVSSLKEVMRSKAQMSQLIGLTDDQLKAMGIDMTQKGVLEAYNALQSADLSQKDQAELTRDYYRAAAPVNYQMDLNKLESDAVTTYYGVLLAQEQYRIAEDDLKVKQEILSNVEKKFAQGIAAKIDVITAETAVANAQSNVAAARAALDSAKMGLNIQLGYPLMQSVNLTDSLEQIDAPNITLPNAIASALDQRQALKDAKFAVELNKKILLAKSVRYPYSSSTYKTAQNNLLKSEQQYENAVKAIEMDIRNQYTQLQNNASAIKAAQATLANAQEGLRLKQLSYDVGMATLSDVEEAQVTAYNAALLVASKINAYDLAVYKFKYSTDVGVSAGSSAS